MDTPLFKALQDLICEQNHRLHMPGHKGEMSYPFCEVAPFDVTEVPGTGSLFESCGPIMETEQKIEQFYKTGASLISAGGSTLSIQTMLRLFCTDGDKILIGRNCHLSAVNAMALLDITPVWLYPDIVSGKGTSGKISPELIEQQLLHYPEVAAVYITSPDYFGSIADIEGISKVCRRNNKPLLVDNAHGAHLKFFNIHPIELGADACCDSFHKTLPVLTGGGALHLRDAALKEKARDCMSVFASTSPSYLIMLSIDMAVGKLAYLQEQYLTLAQKVSKIAKKALAKGIWATVGERDPIRVTLYFDEKNKEHTLALLRQLKIEAEYISPCHVVLIPSPNTDCSVIEQLVEQMHSSHCEESVPIITPPRQAMSIRKAMFSPKEQVEIKDAVGRVSGSVVSSCPPGLPVIIPGEIIDEKTIKNITGKTDCFVVK